MVEQMIRAAAEGEVVEKKEQSENPQVLKIPYCEPILSSVPSVSEGQTLQKHSSEASLP